MENSMVVPWKTKYKTTIWPAIPLLGISSRGQNYNLKRHMHPDVHRSPIHNSQDKPKCPLTEESTKKTWHRDTVEYYSAIKKNKIMPFAAKWMQLEIIIPSEVRKRKTNTIRYHLYVECKILHKRTYLQNRKRLTDIQSRPVVAKGERRGRGREFGIK